LEIAAKMKKAGEANDKTAMFTGLNKKEIGKIK